jgi:hypothetical protein
MQGIERYGYQQADWPSGSTMISRLFFKEIAGKRVFYPFGRIGAGYIVKSVQRGRIESFLRRFLVFVTLVTVAFAASLAVLGATEPALVGAIYVALLVLYAVRIALFIRRLKVLPMQANEPNAIRA